MGVSGRRLAAQADSQEQRKELRGGTGVGARRDPGDGHRTCGCEVRPGTPAGSPASGWQHRRCSCTGTVEEDHPAEQPPAFPQRVPAPRGRTGRSRRWHRGCTQRTVPGCCRGEQRAQLGPAGRRGLQAAAAQAGSPGSGAGSSLPGGKTPGKPWPRDPAAPKAPAWHEAAPEGDRDAPGHAYAPAPRRPDPAQQQPGLGPAPGGRYRRIGPGAICSDRSGW